MIRINLNMDMPEECHECPFQLKFKNDEVDPWYMRRCVIMRRNIEYPRPEWCPLKDDEAYILTVKQLEDALDTVVWLETPVSENLADGYSLIMAYSHKYGYMFFDSPFGDNPSQERLEYSEYGKSWRCWNKRPTDEQRKVVKWE